MHHDSGGNLHPSAANQMAVQRFVLPPRPVSNMAPKPSTVQQKPHLMNPVVAAVCIMTADAACTQALLPLTSLWPPHQLCMFNTTACCTQITLQQVLCMVADHAPSLSQPRWLLGLRGCYNAKACSTLAETSLHNYSS